MAIKMPTANAVQIGVLAALGNFFIFQHYMPPVTDVRTVDPYNTDVEKSERQALYVSIAFTAIVAGSVKSWDTFLVAGAAIVAVDFAYKHANAVWPATGSMKAPATAGTLDTNNVQQYPMPDYATQAA